MTNCQKRPLFLVWVLLVFVTQAWLYIWYWWVNWDFGILHLQISCFTLEKFEDEGQPRFGYGDHTCNVRTRNRLLKSTCANGDSIFVVTLKYSHLFGDTQRNHLTGQKGYWWRIPFLSNFRKDIVVFVADVVLQKVINLKSSESVLQTNRVWGWTCILGVKVEITFYLFDTSVDTEIKPVDRHYFYRKDIPVYLFLAFSQTCKFD